MKVTLLNKLLQEKGWQAVRKYNGHCLFSHSLQKHATYFIMPVFHSEQVPVGTLNAILRSARKTTVDSHWSTSVRQTKVIHVVLEKQHDYIWSRVDLPGLVVTSLGSSVEEAISTVRFLLTDYLTDEGICCPSIFESVVFEPVYDTTIVWDLFRQVKANHIAGQAGIDTELVSKFMTGLTFPSVEQAERLEASIHELGRQLMQLSIR